MNFTDLPIISTLEHDDAGGGRERAGGVQQNLGGSGKPVVIVAALDSNWPSNSLIDKCYEQTLGAGGGRA